MSRDGENGRSTAHMTHNARDVMVAGVSERRSAEGLVLDAVEGGVELCSLLKAVAVFRVVR